MQRIPIAALGTAPDAVPGLPAPKWGFFGHRRLNRLAIFTLPSGLVSFYKKHIEYVTEHAVDPDKRRYASTFEASRHFLDLDRYGVAPFEGLPRRWSDACARFTDVYIRTPVGDTVLVFGHEQVEEAGARFRFIQGSMPGAAYWPAEGVSREAYQDWFAHAILPQYYEDVWRGDCAVLQAVFGTRFSCEEVIAVDTFSAHGILPYHLAQMQRRLTAAFQSGKLAAILQISAEFGHYIGDAHVPLHTTSNYNGQLSGQLGIHAFWESRIPELYADARYDFFVGPAKYIADPVTHYWNIVLDSHQLVDSVLSIERKLKAEFPADRQFCYEGRGGVSIRTQCPEYAFAFQERMQGMVERQMRKTIQAIGSAWFTAWVDAGQPDLMRLGITSDKKNLQEAKEVERAWKRGRGFGRAHE